MSSRSSRRSGANGNVLNKATITLLPRDRLVKELTDRGLDATGTKNDLATRLYDFVENGFVPPPPAAVVEDVATPSAPQPSSTPKTTPKSAAGRKPKAVKTPNTSESETVTPVTKGRRGRPPKAVKVEVIEQTEEEEKEEEEEVEEVEIPKEIEAEKPKRKYNKKTKELILEIVDDAPDLQMLTNKQVKMENKADEPEEQEVRTRSGRRSIKTAKVKIEEPEEELESDEVEEEQVVEQQNIQQPPTVSIKQEPMEIEQTAESTKKNATEEQKPQISNNVVKRSSKKSEKQKLDDEWVPPTESAKEEKEKERPAKLKREASSDEDLRKSNDSMKVSKKIRTSNDVEKDREHVKKSKPSSSSHLSSGPKLQKSNQTSWQAKWAEKMAEMKKAEASTAAPLASPVPKPSPVEKQTSVSEKEKEKVSDNVRRKESGDKSHSEVKKSKIDEIAELMTSTLPKVTVKQEVKERNFETGDGGRAKGGAEGLSREFGVGTGFMRNNEKKDLWEPTPRFFAPIPAKAAPKIIDPMLIAPPPPPPPLPQQPSPSASQVPLMPHPVSMGMTPPIYPKSVSLIPPPPPPIMRRKSRFDQPPPELLKNMPMNPKSIGLPPAPPTLATGVAITGQRKKSCSPPPPPPPRKMPKMEDARDVPPPPPKRQPTAGLRERIKELFSFPGDSDKEEDESEAAEVSSPVSRNTNAVTIKAEVEEPVKVVQEKTETRGIEDEEEDDDDDDGGFVIRETVVETETKVLVKKENVPPPAVEEHQDLVTEEGREENVEQEDEEEEYDPFENTNVEESTIFEYVPSTKTNDQTIIEFEDEHEDELDEGEMEVDEEIEIVDDEPMQTGQQVDNVDVIEVDDDDDDEIIEVPGEPDDEVVFLQNVKEVEIIHEKRPIKPQHNPMDLLKKALPLLKSMTRQENQTSDENNGQQYVQMTQEVVEIDETNKEPEENQGEKYYHGEPVPEIDDNDLFAIAAGLKPAKKKEKKALVQIPDEERLPQPGAIELDYYNADIHVKSAEKDIWMIEPFTNDGLALMWGGVRSNYGIKLPFKPSENGSTKIGFQIILEQFPTIQHLPTDFISEGGDVRVGFSLASAPLVLGEYSGSWCISSSGKKATCNLFTEFGATFDIGDVITCVLDLAEKSIKFLKNNKEFGKRFENLALRDGDVIHPTICVKNANVHVNLGQSLEEERWDLPEGRDWRFLTETEKTSMECGRTAPIAKSECTVLMTVGLPGVGKTTWVRRYLAEHPHEHWTVISADMVVDAMRINGVPRNRLPSLKRPDYLRGIIGKSMARLIMLAPRRRKNYVLDMTNCIMDKRKRKLMAFEEFNRKCMVFVPDEDVHTKRLIRQEHDENEKLDTDALMQHKAAMSIPTTETDPCEEIIFIDPPNPFEHLAFDRVQKMNYDCRGWLVTNHRRRGGHHQFHNRNQMPPQYANNMSAPSGSGGPPSGGGGGYQHYHYQNNQYSRPMNITHTTFPSSSATSAPPPTSQVEMPSPVVAAVNKPEEAQPVNKPLTQTNAESANLKAIPTIEPQTIIKTDLTKPIFVSLPRKSIDSHAGPSSSSSASVSFKKEITTEIVPGPSPRMIFASSVPPPMDTNLPPPTTIPPPTNVPPPSVVFQQPPPAMVMHVPFPVDMNIPPPNFHHFPPPSFQQNFPQPPPMYAMNFPPPPTTPSSGVVQQQPPFIPR